MNQAMQQQAAAEAVRLRGLATDQQPESRRQKQARVRAALKDPTLRMLTDRALAVHCKVSHMTIAKARREMFSPRTNARRRISLDGRSMPASGYGQ